MKSHESDYELVLPLISVVSKDLLGVNFSLYNLMLIFILKRTLVGI